MQLIIDIDSQQGALASKQPSDTTAVTPTDSHQADLIQQQLKTQHYIHASTSDRTRQAYQSAIRQFEKWGGRLPTTTQIVVSYLLSRCDTLNVRTLELHLTAISQWHRYQGITDPVREPVVQKCLEGIRREHGRPKKKAKALQLEHLAAMLSYLRSQPTTLKSTRDIALLLTGFMGAFRRSELVAIRVEDLSWQSEGILITLPRSKTDQYGEGSVRALPSGMESASAVVAIEQWLKLAGLSSGPLFRAVNRWDQLGDKPLYPGSVNDILKKIGTQCGFDFILELSSHSLRRGLSTSAARESVDFELIKKQGGWRDDAVVREYIEAGRLFADNATHALMARLHELNRTL
ncbi:integrase [Ectothiorhodospiraceae bacterium BW-2]|nr:integrase [Ectothiorhodospiraceae bacterium BW-2]